MKYAFALLFTAVAGVCYGGDVATTQASANSVVHDGRSGIMSPIVLGVHVAEWRIRLREDGSAFVEHGSYPMYFDSGSFDTQTIVRQLRARLSGERPGPGWSMPGATFYGKNSTERVELWAKDDLRPVADVFELIRRAGRKSSPAAQQTWRKLWQEDPPTPLNLPWDADVAPNPTTQP